MTKKIIAQHPNDNRSPIIRTIDYSAMSTNEPPEVSDCREKIEKIIDGCESNERIFDGIEHALRSGLVVSPGPIHGYGLLFKSRFLREHGYYIEPFEHCFTKTLPDGKREHHILYRVFLCLSKEIECRPEWFLIATVEYECIEKPI